jgi:hypothetical protein
MSHTPARRRRLVVLLALGAVALTAATCPQVVVDSPRHLQIVDDPAVPVVARFGQNIDAATSEILLDGVDLIAALGLVPPFTGAGGVVVIGSQSVTVSAFEYLIAPPQPQRVRFTLTGLDPTTHVIELRGVNALSELQIGTRTFSVSTPLVLALDALDAGGNAAPKGLVSGSSASATSLAPPWSAGRIEFSDGSSIGTAVAGAAAALAPGGAP